MNDDRELLAVCRVMMPQLFRNGLPGYPSDGPATTRRRLETIETAKKILAAINAVRSDD